MVQNYISKFSVGLYLIDSTAFENKFFAPCVKPEIKRFSIAWNIGIKKKQITVGCVFSMSISSEFYMGTTTTGKAHLTLVQNLVVEASWDWPDIFSTSFASGFSRTIFRLENWKFRFSISLKKLLKILLSRYLRTQLRSAEVPKGPFLVFQSIWNSKLVLYVLAHEWKPNYDPV